MLVLAKSVLAMMIGFISSAIFGLIMIPVLKKFNIKQKINIFLEEKHKEKQGVPTMGGLIFIIPTIAATLFLLLLGKIHYSSNLLIVLIVFASYALLGFIDDFLSIKRRRNEGLTVLQKLIGQLLIAIIFFVIFIKNGGKTALNIYTLGVEIDMGFIYGAFILFVLIATSNAVNITDGLDGLAGGLSVMSFLAFALISFGSTWVVGYSDIAIFCFILTGALMGFLLFNTYPAKVIMGDTGSLTLGGTLAAVAIITNHELTLVIVAGVFVIETLLCIIQIIAGRYFGKKVFLMAPLHHHFEKLGWEERDIVKLFWTAGLLLSMAAIGFGVWI